jgi:DNA-binding GntR family transcriptional regulator
MSLTDTIADDLRSDILAGEFTPGERLLEVHLAERYTCGRAAVRAALVELTSEGLVERIANRGATVRRITIEDAIQITEARAALESLIAAHAARHASSQDCEELTRIVADMQSAVSEDRHQDYSELNAVLHRRLHELSQHRVAGDLVTNLRNQAAHHQYRLAMMPGRPAQSLEQHAAIVEAVVAGDENGASKAMHVHLQSVIEVLGRWGDAV